MKTVELTQLAYSIPNFAKACDISVTTVREHIDHGNLIPGYVNTKPIISKAEGERWLASLPSERVA